MKKAIFTFGAAALFALAAWPMVQAEDNYKDRQAELPEAVRAVIAERTAGGEIKEIEVENEDGAKHYEVEYFKDGEEREFELNADGKVLKSGDDDEKDEHGKEGKEGREEKEDEDEKQVELKDAPAAVRDALAKLFPAGNLKSLTCENEDGRKVYEASYTVDGAEKEIELGEGGAVLEKSEYVESSALPDAVRAAIEKAHPGSKIVEAEAKQYFHYEIKVEKDGKKKEISLTPDGKVDDDDEDDD